MGQLSTFGGISVPSASDAAIVPAHLLDIVNQLCGTSLLPARVTHVVSSKAERDANFDGLRAGSLVICPNVQTIWLSLGKVSGTQTWRTVFLDTGWITAGFTYDSNWTAYATNSVRVRRTGGNNFLRVQATYNGASIIHADDVNTPRPGNITNMPVLTQVPSGFNPNEEWTATFRTPYTSGSALFQPSGAVIITDMHTDSTIEPTHFIQMQFIWPADD